MKIECPHCQQHYEVDDTMTGRVQCTRCQQEFDIEPTESTEPTEKSVWGKISDVLNTEIKISEDEPQKVPDNIIKNEIAATNKDELNVDLTVPNLLYFLSGLIILGTVIGLLGLERDGNPFYGIHITCIISGGVVSSLLFIGLGRLISSGIVIETYLKDLHTHLTGKEHQ